METGSMMLKHPLFFPFGQPQLFFPFGRRVAVATTQSLLNVQKLSLPANTAVGSQVSVTDGFVVSDPNGPDNAYPSIGGLYLHVGTSGGKHSYNLLGLLDTESKIQWNGFSWVFNDIGAVGVYHSDDDVEEPWLVTTWVIDEGHTSVPTLTHPALQQLTAPATAQGGVFVAGGSQDGVYSIRGTQEGKAYFNLLGQPNSGPEDDAFSVVGWDSPNNRFIIGDEGGSTTYYSLSDVATPDLAGSDKFVMVDSNDNVYSKRGTFNGKPYYNKLGSSTSTALDAIFWSSATWHITNALGVDADTSTSAVATPDLATFLLGTVVSNVAWLNADDDSPASIAVTSVTQGELDAGLTVTGSGTPEINKVHLKSAVSTPNGRTAYDQIDLASDELAFAPVTGWNWSDVYSSTDTAFPWQAVYSLNGAPAPVPTVARNDVATEANWEVV